MTHKLMESMLEHALQENRRLKRAIRKLTHERDEARSSKIVYEHGYTQLESYGNAASQWQMAAWSYGEKVADKLFPEESPEKKDD